MQTLTRILIPAPIEADTAAERHLVDVARALADMRACATAISTTQLMDEGRSDTVGRLLSTLAATYGLRYTMTREGPSVTVRFERREL